MLGSVRSVSRFTPTGVGTINAPHGDRTYSAVHPHGRGDNCQIDGYDVFVDGSPPRAWGQSRGLYAEAGLMRFTPTGVGTINVDGLQTGRDAVHPHGRGDNTPQTAPSPVPARFTPTGVGTIATASASATLTTVHPHGRGDNGCPARRWIASAGSPPRAWGQYLLARMLTEAARFTPTGVGTIRDKISHTTSIPVHPHGRGDNDSAQRLGRYQCGSPPRAWGQSGWSQIADEDVRFTPTGVGTI